MLLRDKFSGTGLHAKPQYRFQTCRIGFAGIREVDFPVAVRCTPQPVFRAVGLHHVKAYGFVVVRADVEWSICTHKPSFQCPKEADA